MKDNFNKFNYPFENKGSVTVTVEDNLAEVWQDCLETQYGHPKIVKNQNCVETDRMWKFLFGIDPLQKI